MGFTKKVKHPINRKLLFNVVGFGCIAIIALVLFCNMPDVDKKPEVAYLESKDSVIYDTICITDTLIVKEYRVDTLIKHKLIHDTIYKDKYIYSESIDTLIKYTDEIRYIDTCNTPKPYKWFYLHKFRQHRYPGHGPLWELDSI